VGLLMARQSSVRISVKILPATRVATGRGAQHGRF